MRNKWVIMRAEEEWQRAGAYSVRIQGMNRKYHMPLRDEFDDKDCDGTRYIVVLDDEYPVGTCRFFRVDDRTVSLGRLVVLPEYRGQGMGSVIIKEAEKWIGELGYSQIEIDSRIEAVDFYRKNGFSEVGDDVVESGIFKCIPMKKTIQ